MGNTDISQPNNMCVGLWGETFVPRDTCGKHETYTYHHCDIGISGQPFLAEASDFGPISHITSAAIWLVSRRPNLKRIESGCRETSIIRVGDAWLIINYYWLLVNTKPTSYRTCLSPFKAGYIRNGESPIFPRNNMGGSINCQLTESQTAFKCAQHI